MTYPKSVAWRLPFLISLVLLIGFSANARLFVVADTNDTVKITSLRGAILAANRTGGNNFIILGGRSTERQRTIYSLTFPSGGKLVINCGSLTIVGMSPDVVIDATRLGDRVFHVMTNASLTLMNLTVTGAFTYSFGQEGGAIYNSGTLIIEHCSIVRNTSGEGSDVLFVHGTGGGIFNEGTLFAENSVVASNAAGADSDGGGVYNSGRAMLNRCIINSNSAGSDGTSSDSGFPAGNGGGICNVGTMTLRNCLISANQAGHGGTGYEGVNDIEAGEPALGGAGGSGGGIWNSGHLKLFSCTISGNACGAGGDGGSNLFGGGPAGPGGVGGGIFNTAILAANTCTISSNFSGSGGNGGSGMFGPGGNGNNAGDGGGIYNEGTANLTSCTIALNQTGAGGNGGNGVGSPLSSGGSGGNGGGIFNRLAATNVTMRNTLTALNLANPGGLGGTNQGMPSEVGNNGTSGADFDVAGDFASLGFNLIGTADGGTGFTNALNADQVGSNAQTIDPLLGPLQMNGGFTPTQALLPGSPAIDQGNCFGVHTDQRGHERPQDDPAIPNAPGGDGSDIGAFELPAP